MQAWRRVVKVGWPAIALVAVAILLHNALRGSIVDASVMDTIIVFVVAIGMFWLGWLIVRRQAGGLGVATVSGSVLFVAVMLLAGLIMVVVTTRGNSELAFATGMQAVGTSFALFLPIALVVSFLGGALARYSQ
jgi:hypothetical protein